MKKVVLASLLAVASTIQISHYAVGQQAAGTTGQAAGATGQASGEISLPPAENNAYNAAIAESTPAAKAQALEAFLTQYPNSQVKVYVLEQLVQAYTQADPSKILPTADRLLQTDPANLRALTMEVYFRKNAADQNTDPTQKQAGLDAAAEYAQKGLAAAEVKPKGLSDADYQQLKSLAVPTFYSAIGEDQLNKGDAAAAVETYKKEMSAVPLEQTKTPGSVLLDEFLLGQAYMQEKPQDLVNCAFYTARAASFAPDNIKAQMLKTSQYCYNKYHGKLDGFDAVQQAAEANLNPPSGFAIAPAPKPADLAHQAVTSTPDLTTLALADREFILANGTQEDPTTHVKDADKVWDTMKGKSYTIPDALVIASSPTQLQVAVSDDAVQTKTADFTVKLTPPAQPDEPTSKAPAARARYKHEMDAYQKQVDALAAATAVGNKVTFSGTYDSYTTTPTLMINMTDGQIQLPKAAAPARPAARRGGAGRRK